MKAFGPVLTSGAAILVAGALASCRPAAEEGENVAGGNASIPPIPLPVAEAPLDREDLLLAVVRAASAHAAGSDDSAEQRRLDGKRFELRIRFGCPGVAQAEGALSASVEDRSSLELRAAPNVFQDDPIVIRLGGADFEAVEGFWLARPWMLDAACPARSERPAQVGDPKPSEVEIDDAAAPDPPEAVNPAATRPMVGIAQFFTQSDPRTSRRGGRPYTTRKTLQSGSAPSTSGYDLVLSGRLRRMPGGRVIACGSPTEAESPACVISAEFDLVRFERPDTSEVLAEWGRS